jgi:transcriptional regulator with XRE-family HTH domain
MHERQPVTAEEHFAATLRQVRAAAGWSQRQLADVLGKPQSFVSKIELGAQRITLNEAADLASALGLSLPGMLGGTPGVSPATMRRTVELAVRRQIAAEILAGVPGCPAACDEDRREACHESHAVPQKRGHDPERCGPGAFREAPAAAPA